MPVDMDFFTGDNEGRPSIWNTCKDVYSKEFKTVIFGMRFANILVCHLKILHVMKVTNQ
jgi:hypothetical protein